MSENNLSYFSSCNYVPSNADQLDYSQIDSTNEFNILPSLSEKLKQEFKARDVFKKSYFNINDLEAQLENMDPDGEAYNGNQKLLPTLVFLMERLENFQQLHPAILTKHVKKDEVTNYYRVCLKVEVMSLKIMSVLANRQEEINFPNEVNGGDFEEEVLDGEDEDVQENVQAVGNEEVAQNQNPQLNPIIELKKEVLEILKEAEKALHEISLFAFQQEGGIPNLRNDN